MKPAKLKNIQNKIMTLFTYIMVKLLVFQILKQMLEGRFTILIMAYKRFHLMLTPDRDLLQLNNMVYF